MCRHADRGQVAGVLEVIQTSEDMVFGELVEILSQVPAVQLYAKQRQAHSHGVQH